MNVMLKTEPFGQETCELRKQVDFFGHLQGAALIAFSGAIAPSKGVDYEFGFRSPAFDAYKFGIGGYCARETGSSAQRLAWGLPPRGTGLTDFGKSLGALTLLGAQCVAEAVEPAKRTIEVAAKEVARRTRRQLREAPELYPDLDFTRIKARAEELRGLTTDSEAISRVLDQPVRVIHQAE